MKWNALNTVRLKPMPRRGQIQTGTRFSNPLLNLGLSRSLQYGIERPFQRTPGSQKRDSMAG